MGRERAGYRKDTTESANAQVISDSDTVFLYKVGPTFCLDSSLYVPCSTARGIRTEQSLMLEFSASIQQIQHEMVELKQLLTLELRTDPELAHRLAMVTSPGRIDDGSSIRSKTSILSTETERCFRGFAIAYEKALVETRVYKKASRNSSTGSFKSIQTADSNWS